ncbi:MULTISPECIES: hypothetical protein [Fusobacterium]|uniref:hypothetical protein n=1 Tax=Fusobacterium TaxID=848 RepID=UPI001477015F|nr:MULTISPECIES: hypothetical protein [Fusobacterium]NME36478.1 hypothetical protein [Fusobacterium sp. FSA-380-WT-3A]
MKYLKRIVVSLFISLFMIGCMNLNSHLLDSQVIYNKEFVFDAERIKKVFCQWELTKETTEDEHFLRFYNKEKDICIDFSNYGKRDTPEKMAKKFHKGALKKGFKENVQGNIEAEKFFNEYSKEYTYRSSSEDIIRNDLIFGNLTVVFWVTNGSEKDVIDTFKMIKEAIDPNEPIKPRKPLGKVTYYQFEDIFDTGILEEGLKKYPGKYKKYISGNNSSKESPSGYLYVFNDGKKSLRIEYNKNFSKEVINKRWDKEMWYPEPGSIIRTYYGKENKTSIKYFGVPAMEYRLTSKYDIPSMSYKSTKNPYLIIQYYYVITTDIYSIILKLEEPKQKEEKDVNIEFEKLLKIIAKSTKLK